MKVSVKLNTKDAERAIRQLRQRAPQAISRALNRAAKSGEVVMVRAVAADLGIKQGDVRETMTVQEARPDSLVARIVTTGKRLSLLAFNPRQTRTGVTARLKGSAGKYPAAFVVTRLRSGHGGVFKRKGRARLPIEELSGPSVPHVFAKHLSAGLARAMEQLAKNLKSELAHAIRQAGKS